MIGLKELAMLAVVVLALYGRSGVLKSRRFQSIWPWIAPVRRTTGRPGVARGASAEPRQTTQSDQSPTRGLPSRSRLLRLEGNRLFWFVTILAATAVTAWIVTRLLILNGANTALIH
jgi:hypothetical protein